MFILSLLSLEAVRNMVQWIEWSAFESSQGDFIVLCPWVRHLTLTVPSANQEYELKVTGQQSVRTN